MQEGIKSFCNKAKELGLTTGFDFPVNGGYPFTYYLGDFPLPLYGHGEPDKVKQFMLLARKFGIEKLFLNLTTKKEEINKKSVPWTNENLNRDRISLEGFLEEKGCKL